LDEASRITAWNLSAIDWTLGRAMSAHADAEPMIGPTRPARSRTIFALSPADAPAVQASNAPKKAAIQRGRELRATVILDLKSDMVAAP
jgi:hypothetical protein